MDSLERVDVTFVSPMKARKSFTDSKLRIFVATNAVNCRRAELFEN
jgi:hypothetical protein